MATIKKEKSTQKKEQKLEKILLLPILFFTTLYLFGVRVRLVSTYVGDQFWHMGGDQAGDLYGYFRMQMLVLVTVVFLLFLIACIVTGSVKLQKHKIYIPMAIYSLMVMLSYAFSAHKGIALFGYLSRYEGTVSLLCYMALIFYTMHAIGSEKGVRLIVRCFAVACLVLGIWGILQTRGIRLSALPDWLYIPASFRENAQMSQNMVTTAVNWFFSNQNYTSFFMVFPIGIFSLGCVAEEDFKKKLLYAVLTCLMLFNLWQSASLGGMVGLAVAFVVALLVVGVENLKKWRKSIGLLFLAAVVSVAASLPVILREVQSGTAFGKLFDVDVAYATEMPPAESFQFEEIDYIKTEGLDVIFAFDGEEFRVKTDGNAVIGIIDASGKDVTDRQNLLWADTYIDEDSGYPIVAVRTARVTWNFVLADGQSYFITPSGKTIQLDRVESMGFEEHQSFATYRGYIWSRTLPLLKDTLLLGHGADTFPMYFPQDDYAGRYNIAYYNDAKNIIIDKPHNLYLATAVNTGVISLVALLAIYVIYLIESVKIYRKHEFIGFVDYIGLGIFVAIAGYMISALVNDGTVQMMPLVYVFLGMGFAINRMIRNREK